MKAIVVAIDRKNGIGADNDLLWHSDLPTDLQHFKDITTGGTVIMGRKTYEGIGRALPNRENIVVSRKLHDTPGVIVVDSIENAYSLAQHNIYVIGGGQIYAATIDDMDELFVTEVDAEFPKATVSFPTIDPSIWHEISREHHTKDEKNKYNFDFVHYTKK